MRPHPRIRKVIKWSGAVVTVLLVMMWTGSGWWWVSLLPTQRHWLTAKCGAVALSDDPLLVQMSALLPRVLRRPPPPPDRFEWWLSDTGARSSGSSIGIARINTRTRTLTVLLWPWIILAAGATGAAWRLDWVARRRQRALLCPKCNYDRTGLARGANCPECGIAPSSV